MESSSECKATLTCSVRMGRSMGRGERELVMTNVDYNDDYQ